MVITELNPQRLGVWKGTSWCHECMQYKDKNGVTESAQVRSTSDNFFHIFPESSLQLILFKCRVLTQCPPCESSTRIFQSTKANILHKDVKVIRIEILIYTNWPDRRREKWKLLVCEFERLIIVVWSSQGCPQFSGNW